MGEGRKTFVENNMELCCDVGRLWIINQRNIACMLCRRSNVNPAPTTSLLFTEVVSILKAFMEDIRWTSKYTKIS